MKVKFGIFNFHVVDFRSGFVGFFHEAADLATRSAHGAISAGSRRK